jgi:hypothetical protein
MSIWHSQEATRLCTRPRPPGVLNWSESSSKLERTRHVVAIKAKLRLTMLGNVNTMRYCRCFQLLGFRIRPDHGAWVPHISLVFREMWDATALSLPPLSFNRPFRAEGRGQWYPTSREKRARCGAPRLRGQFGSPTRKPAPRWDLCVRLLAPGSLRRSGPRLTRSGSRK